MHIEVEQKILHQYKFSLINIFKMHITMRIIFSDHIKHLTIVLFPTENSEYCENISFRNKRMQYINQNHTFILYHINII